MAWVESHLSLDRHPKLFALMEALKIDRRTAVGMLHLLWHWCVEYALNGELSKYSPTQIAMACDWTGNPGELVQALADNGFLERDPLRIHDWFDFCGELVKKRLEYRAAKTERSKEILGESRRILGHSLPTIPNHTNTTSCEPDPKSKVPKSPNLTSNHRAEVLEVIAYFNTKTGKNLTLTSARAAVVTQRLGEGRGVGEMKRAIDNFVKDDWPDRRKYMDLVYVIGVRNKVDNLDKWLNYEPKAVTTAWM